MKTFKFLLLLAILSVSDYAFAQIPECPCDTLELQDGTTGNDIVELLCPGGQLGNDVFSVIVPEAVVIGDLFAGYAVESVGGGEFACLLASEGGGLDGIQITEDQFTDCSERLIQGCDLKSIRPIPTLSEWGMIAMAGVLGITGLILARRNKVAA